MANSQDSKNGLDVAIVGGGKAGGMLTIALLKHCPHFQIIVYESTKFGEIEAHIGFSLIMQRTMALIDLRISVAFQQRIKGSEEPEISGDKSGSREALRSLKVKAEETIRMALRRV